ncbi:MAG: protein product from [Planctomycetota bacterium]|nr:MAG: protein product from [Planctomycetota bacterium]
MRTFALLVVLAASLLVTGCHRHRVVVHDADAVWDGHVWVTVTHHVHGLSCGHYWHHGCWHLYPDDYVYFEAGYGHYGLYVDYVRESDPYVWDGSVWVVVRGHVHGPRCGHYYHHDRWHVYDERHVYERRDQGHWGTRIEPRRPERPQVETPGRKPPPPPPKAEPPPRKPEKPKRPEPPKQPKPPRKPDRPK